MTVTGRAPSLGTSRSLRPRIGARLRLVLACVSVPLMSALTGCTGSSPGPPQPGGGSPASGHPATAQAATRPSAGSAWGAATHLDSGHGSEEPTSVSCPSASFCMAVIASGYESRYDGTRWSQPARLSSPGVEPGSVSCPTASFCMAADAHDPSAFLFNGSTWSPAPRVNDPAQGTLTGLASVSCSSPAFCVAIDNGSNAFTFNGTS